MNEKRKPYATIMIQKPRVSLLLSAILVAAIAAVAAGGILHDRDQRAAEVQALQESLDASELLLMKAETESGAISDRLKAAERQLADYQKRFTEPAGYYDYSDGRGKWLRLFSCSRIVLDSFKAGNGATLVFFNVIDRKAAAELTRRDNYTEVGQIPWAPEGERPQTIFFYMRQDVLADGDFLWPDSDEWPLVNHNWEEYLDNYCQQL